MTTPRLETATTPDNRNDNLAVVFAGWSAQRNAHSRNEARTLASDPLTTRPKGAGRRALRSMKGRRK